MVLLMAGLPFSKMGSATGISEATRRHWIRDPWSAWFDDLVDTCNGLAAAIKVFFLVSRVRGYALPRELLVEALQEQTSAPWWTIDGCVEGEVLGRSQLTVYARPESRDYQKVLWSTFQSGILVESLGVRIRPVLFLTPVPKGASGLGGLRTGENCEHCVRPELPIYRGTREYWRTISFSMYRNRVFRRF